MFGWEFPPHIAGGLGTACYGMTRGLARNGVDVTFIVPHAYGDEDQRFTHVVNASDVEALYGSTGSGADDILVKMSFILIDSNMVPFIVHPLLLYHGPLFLPRGVVSYLVDFV